MPLHHADTPERHVRRALQLLEELEDDLRVPASSIPAQYDQVELLTAARRRLWLAVAALRSPDDPRDRFLRRLLPVGSIMVKAAILAAFGAGFLLRSVWRCMRGVLRLVFTLRAIWP
jgi:hypothetical protein